MPPDIQNCKTLYEADEMVESHRLAGLIAALSGLAVAFGTETNQGEVIFTVGNQLRRWRNRAVSRHVPAAFSDPARLPERSGYDTEAGDAP